MKIKEIRPELPEYREIERIYKSSFPEDQRLPFEEFQKLLVGADTSFLAFYDEDKLAGFTHLFHFEDYTIISYLAVNPAVRSKGLGSRILQELRDYLPGRTMIAEVEGPDQAAANQEQRLRRLHFYDKNGFTPTGYHIDYGDMTFLIYWTGGDSFDTAKYYKVYEVVFGPHGYKPIPDDQVEP